MRYTKNKRRFVQWSKFVTGASLVLASGFLIWACYEMHRLNDLTPIAYIGAAVLGLATAVVGAYMWRAKQHDLFVLEMKKTEEMAKLRKKYGQNTQSEQVSQPGNETSGYFGGGYG